MCAYLRLDGVEENIEGNANLHHPPGVGLSYPDSVSAVLQIFSTTRKLFALIIKNDIHKKLYMCKKESSNN